MINNYKDLSIKKYNEILALTKDSMDGIISADVFQFEVLSVLSDMDSAKIINLPLDEYHSMVQESKFLLKPLTVSGKRIRHLSINGKDAYVVKDAKSLVAGQYIDYSNYLKMDNVEEEHLHQVMSVFIIPEGHSYGDGYDMEEWADEINEHLSIVDAKDISFFFQKESRKSLNRTLNSLVWTMKARSMMEKNAERREKMKESIVKLKELRTQMDSALNGVGL